jgi:hypothetical protein
MIDIPDWPKNTEETAALVNAIFGTHLNGALMRFWAQEGYVESDISGSRHMLRPAEVVEFVARSFEDSQPYLAEYRQSHPREKDTKTS